MNGRVDDDNRGIVLVTDEQLHELGATDGMPVIVETETGDVHPGKVVHDARRGFHVRVDDWWIDPDCSAVTVRRRRP